MKDHLPPTFAHDMITDMVDNQLVRLKYNRISQETYRLTKIAIPTSLAGEAAGNMLDEYNRSYTEKSSKANIVIKYRKAENDLIDNIQRIE